VKQLLQVPTLRPHRNPVQGSNRMWLPLAKTQEQGLSVQARPQRTTRRCAACRGEHKAWNYQCPTRKAERAKARAAYDVRSYYHPVAETPRRSIPSEVPAATVRRSKLAQAPALTRRRSPGIDRRLDEDRSGPMRELLLTQWSSTTRQHTRTAAKGRKSTPYLPGELWKSPETPCNQHRAATASTWRPTRTTKHE
jgi:hypothetical protein